MKINSGIDLLGIPLKKKCASCIPPGLCGNDNILYLMNLFLLINICCYTYWLKNNKKLN